MADEIVIDASALKSFNYAEYLSDYFTGLTTAGEATYYGGTYSENVKGYNTGSQFGVRYPETTNSLQVLMEGSDIQYDGIDGKTHGAYSGDVDSITFGAYDANTKSTTGDNNGPRSELTGVIDGLVVSNLDISTPFGTMAGPDNTVKTLMDALKNAGIETDGVETSIAKLYEIFASRAQHFIGTDGDDTYVGTTFDDIAEGGKGNDSLDGGAGADTLKGGLGDDTYYVDNLKDVVTEVDGEGTDTIVSSVSHYQIAENVENLIQATGTAALWSYGNDLDNTMTGNAGDSSLLGLAGNDTLIGGAGNDTLNGGEGDDTMTGGVGNDTYVVDSKADVVTEVAGEGTDTIQTTLNHYMLAANVENLVLTGEEDLAGYGNDANNTVTGNKGDNILAGQGGNDVLDGGEGADMLFGGAGNDKYIVSDADDLVSEADQEGVDEGGVDTVQASISYTLGSFVEKLTLTGEEDLSGTGNGLDNVITGNSGANVLSGAEGDDKLKGGEGNDTLKGDAGEDELTGGLGKDTLTGGADADTFVFKTGDTAKGKGAADTITDFKIKQGDSIDLHSIDANVDQKGNQDFDFIGESRFHKEAGELRLVKTDADTYVQGDVDGDGKADFTIHLNGVINLKLDHFDL